MKTYLEIAFRRLRLALAVIFLVSGPILHAAAISPTCRQAHGSKEQAPRWSAATTLEQKIEVILSGDIKSESQALHSANWILQQSPKEQENWMQAIGKSYRKVTNKGDRRFLDSMMLQLKNDQEFFEKEINQKNLSPHQAYEIFLSRQSHLFNTNYSAKEVQLVIDWIQKELKALERIYVGTSPKILLVGSFPNGKADLMTSDLDLSVSDDRAMKWLQYWPKKFAEMLKQSGIRANLEIKFSDKPATYFGELNPIVFEITSSQVELKVFSSPTKHTEQNFEPLVFNYR